VAFSPAEARLIAGYAARQGMTFEAAVQELFSTGLAHRVRVRLGRRPSAAVRQFHRGRPR
jgi:hypothetical protein